VIQLPNAHAQLIQDAIRAAQTAGDLPDFDPPPIDIKPPRNPEQGDYACAIAQRLAKPIGKKPAEIADLIIKHLPKAPFLLHAENVNGFINFRLDETWLRNQIDQILIEGDHLFELTLGAGKRAQVEFVSANPTGPLHVGRSRGAMVGDAIARILEAAGYTVEREYYFNNAGQQMKNLGNSLRVRYLQQLGQAIELPNTEEFYQGEYLIDFAKALVSEQGEALVNADWQPFKAYAESQMFEMIKATLARVNIRHDHFFNENSLYESGAVWETLRQLEAAGYIYEAVARQTDIEEPMDETPHSDEKAAAKWFRSTALGDDKDRVLVKGNGEPTYTLPDIAYHMDKLARGFDLAVNILGADHYVQHQVVKRGVQALGGSAEKIRVIIIQMVKLIRDGREYKISTRKGTYETLDDLIDMTSPDAVRYLLLARSPDAQMNFDLDLAVKQSNENPVYYIQYAYVRCNGILREAQIRHLSDQDADLSLVGEEELRFIRKILTLGDEIEFAAQHIEPHKIAFFALELATLFHPLYDKVRVFGEGVPEDVAKARLRFYRAALVTLRRVLALLGMNLPDKM
jgi:arginyl-tRNA synthetase